MRSVGKFANSNQIRNFKPIQIASLNLERILEIVNSPMKSAILLAILAVTSITPRLSAQFGGEADNLIANGTFAEFDDSDQPIDWSEKISHPSHLKDTKTQIQVEEDGEESYLHIERLGSPDVGVALGEQTIEIPEGTESLRLAAKMRGRGIAAGSDFWMVPGISVTYLLEKGETKSGDLNKWLLVPPGDSKWTEYEMIVPVKEGARKANITIIAQGWTGSVDIDDVVVEAIQ